MKNLFFLFLIFFSYQVVGNEIICTNEINIINPYTDEHVVEIGFPNLDKNLSLSNKSAEGRIYGSDFGFAFKEKILIDQNKITFNLYFKQSSGSKWDKPFKRKFKIISNDNISFFVEIINERKNEKEFFEIIKSTNHYTRTVLHPGYRQISRGECTN